MVRFSSPLASNVMRVESGFSLQVWGHEHQWNPGSILLLYRQAGQFLLSVFVSVCLSLLTGSSLLLSSPASSFSSLRKYLCPDALPKPSDDMQCLGQICWLSCLNPGFGCYCLALVKSCCAQTGLSQGSCHNQSSAGISLPCSWGRAGGASAIQS